MKPRKNLSKEDLDYLIEHYHDTPNEELARVLNISIATIKSRRTRHHLRKDDEYISELYRRVAIENGVGARLNTPKAKAKREETLGKLHRNEKVRLSFGLPQKSKRHYRVEPRERLIHRNRLQRLGYIVDNDNLIAYYTPQTKRATRIEKVPRGKKIGYIKGWYDFKPLPEENP